MGALILGIIVGLFFALGWSLLVWCLVRLLDVNTHTTPLLFAGYSMGYVLVILILDMINIPIITTVVEIIFLTIMITVTFVNLLLNLVANKVTRKYHHEEN